MNLIKLSEIEVSPNRQRREFDQNQLRELADSIENQEIGLLHPIVLRTVGDKHILVAGERRSRAVKDSHELGVTVWHCGQPIPPGMIPYVSLGEMEPLAAWEAELEENIRRTDLMWQEKAAATEQLFSLRTAQAAAANRPAPTPSDLAQEVTGETRNAYQERVRTDLILAKKLTDPEVASAKNVKEAMKVVKRQEERARNERITAQVGRTFSSADHRALCIDSEAWTASQPADQFDVILTDPPYGMDADQFGDSGGAAAGAHGYQDSHDNLRALLQWLPGETYRLAKPQAHLYLFCDIEWFPALIRVFSAVGWKCFRTPLIWHKPQAYRAPWPDQGPQRKYETCLYAVKGDKKTKKLAGDVLTFPPDDNLGHAAQKPVALFQELLSRSALAGDSALDLFCGTGPIFPAAHALKIRATGIEQDPASYAISLTRIRGLAE